MASRIRFYRTHEGKELSVTHDAGTFVLVNDGVEVYRGTDYDEATSRFSALVKPQEQARQNLIPLIDTLPPVVQERLRRAGW